LVDVVVSHDRMVVMENELPLIMKVMVIFDLLLLVYKVKVIYLLSCKVFLEVTVFFDL
jgi:hypothetical protein